MKRNPPRGPLAVAGIGGAALLATTALVAPAAASAAAGAPVHAAALTVKQVWSTPIADGANVIAGSSPEVATLDSGGQSVVVGDRSGKVYALHLSDGSPVAGWPVTVPGNPQIDTAPSTNGPQVFVGAGNASNPTLGGYYSFSSTGARLWSQAPPSTPASPTPTSGVDTGLAYGTLQGIGAVVGGSMGQTSDALNAADGAVLPGFPFFQADSNFATPALADLYSNGQTEIVEGGDSTAGLALGKTYSNGGHIRVLDDHGGLLCSYDTNQVVQSSPAVGQFLGGNAVGIVAGTGTFWPGASNTDQMIAVNPHCGLAWTATLDGETNSSPALVDALGNGALQVAEGTAFGTNISSGSIYLLNGSNGSVIWKTTALGGIIGGLASADLGAGYQDIIATTTAGMEILDGKTGAVLWTGLQGALAFQNAPLVTRDANGAVGITVAGYYGGGSRVVHLEVAGSPGNQVGGAGSWPMFHHDDQLTGDAGTPPPAPINVACSTPAGGPDGYWLDASDGGIFAYGNLPFCGSTGSVVLNKPVVGMAGTPDGGGYWLVASDGGIFAFGDARFYGSTGNVALNKPIVGMARTPDGGGYWLVASDGGIFAYGDARFYGSTGNVALNKPVVGMAATPDGKGYWLVASDGGIFAYGDARFYGSTGNIALNKPVVGMAATPDGGGYWLDANDGGIFAYGDARFYGSTGNVALNRPVVGMAATRDGNGYWLVASDGGIFAYGDARFYGSTGNVALNRPVVGMAGY